MLRLSSEKCHFLAKHVLSSGWGLSISSAVKQKYCVAQDDLLFPRDEVTPWKSTSKSTVEIINDYNCLHAICTQMSPLEF